MAFSAMTLGQRTGVHLGITFAIGAAEKNHHQKAASTGDRPRAFPSLLLHNQLNGRATRGAAGGRIDGD
jgi:hypothetical protein